ncbi:MAG: hypothetical protein ACP5I2_06995 [Fervidicoccaceae archaeon]|jgi:hypothetical protein
MFHHSLLLEDDSSVYREGWGKKYPEPIRRCSAISFSFEDSLSSQSSEVLTRFLKKINRIEEKFQSRTKFWCGT